MNITRIAYLVLMVLSGLIACKKDKAEPEEIISPTTGTRVQFTLDSIFLYASQVYLWNDDLPSYQEFNPRVRYEGIFPEFDAYRSELFTISQFKLNSLTGRPYELSVTAGSPKYSYLQTGTSTPGTSAGNGTADQAVLQNMIINSGINKVAYIALGSFPVLNSCKTVLDNAFAQLAAVSPNFLVIDLRSNTGGYVETAEYVANLVAPSALNGKIIFSEQFNSKMQTGNAKILKYQPYLDEAGKAVIYKGRNATMADVDFTEAGNTYKFSKKGNLETITDVYFIISGRTASASELLISSLKPYFNVKLVGETTYGKPVGFFGINIDKYSVYLSSFLIRNSQGWSDYFDGMPPDVFVKGESNPVLGDTNERCLSQVLELINGAPLVKADPKTSSQTLMQLKRESKSAGDSPAFTPLVEHRLKLKQ